MKIYKNGSVVFNSIDNTGSTNEASLGARYAKARLDSTDNNLTLNYYTREQVESLIEQSLSDANLLKAMVVRSVPPVETASQNIIYLVRVSDDEDIYQQYKKVLVSRNPDQYTMALLGSTEVEMENIQVTSLPKASVSVANKVLQYIGESGAYVKGRFYWCASKTYYAWDTSDGIEPGGDTLTATYYVEKSQPEISDDIYSGSYILDEFVPEKFSEIVSIEVEPPEDIRIVDDFSFTYTRNSENDVTIYRWIPLLSKLSEFQNDGDGTSPFVTQQELDDLITDANKIFYAKRDVTTSSEIEAAIRAGKTIQITNSATSAVTVVHSYVGSGYVDLYSVEYDTDKTDVITSFCRYRVAGSVWTTTLAELGAYIATVDVTTELELKEAIGERREILVVTGNDQPHHAVVYAEDKGTDGAYVVCAGIETDTARWNRKRSRFTAYTVLGNLWTAADPIDAVLDSDLVNIVTSLPSTGVANTRYLLKVADTSSAGYHFDEYIYTDSKWVYISQDKPAPFIATINETSQDQLKAAIDSGSPIYVYSDITGVLRPAITASANLFTASIQYLSLSGSSGNYTVDITSCSVVNKTWTATQIGIATKADLEKYVPKLATPISESTTNYLRAFKMNADGLITGTSGSYTKSDTVSSSSTTSQLPSAKAVRDYVATPALVSLTYNTSYIEANYSKCYKVAEKIYMCNIAFQAKSSDIPANTWLIRFPENIVSSGVEVYCVMHCTDRTNVPATLLLQMGGSASFNQFFVKTNPFPGSKYYFGNVMIVKTA